MNAYPNASNPDEVERLIGLICKAADNTDQWQTVLEHVGLATHSRIGFIFLADLSAGGHKHMKILWEAYWGVSERTYRKMQQFPPNPFAQKRHQARPNGPGLGSDLIPYDQYWASDYYRAMSQHADLGRLLGHVTRAGKGSFGALTLWRSRTDPEYTSAELELLRRLAPHLSQSAHLAVKLAEYDAERTMLRATAETLPFGLILLDGSGRPIYVNEAARSVLGPIPERAIGTALPNIPTGRKHAFTTTLDVAGTPHIATAIPLAKGGGRFAGIAPKADAAILFRVVAQQGKDLPQSLQKAWDLTPSEADLALGLMSGCSLKEYAAKRGVTIATVRTHLRNCKSKFGVSRTSELIAFLAQHML